MSSEAAVIKPGRLHPELPGSTAPRLLASGLPEAVPPETPATRVRCWPVIAHSESCESFESDLDSHPAVPDLAADRHQPCTGLEVPTPQHPMPPRLRRSASDSFYQESAIIPSSSSITNSPHQPILLTADHPLTSSLGQQALPINDGRAIPIESPFFSGRACVFICGLPSSPPCLFQGQKRKTMIVVQVARAMSPSMTVGPSHAPSMLMPVVAGCNQIHVAQPGGGPPVNDGQPVEDMRLVDARLADDNGEPLPVAQRRAFFSNPDNRAGRSFDPGLVWTFYFYQHLVDISSYSMRLIYKFHLPHYLDGQPLQLMMKDRRRGEYLFRFLMWHEDLLEDAQRHAGRKA